MARTMYLSVMMDRSPLPMLLSTHGARFYHPHPGDYRRWTGEGLRREIEAPGSKTALPLSKSSRTTLAFTSRCSRAVLNRYLALTYFDLGPISDWERGDALLPPACR